MIVDLQPGDVVIAEKIDRISRLPLHKAEKLGSVWRSEIIVRLDHYLTIPARKGLI